MTERYCAFCGKKIERTDRYKFCSPACKEKYKNIKNSKYTKKTTILLEDILDWNKETFPDNTFKDQVLKVIEEVKELTESGEIEELADVIIACIGCLRYDSLRKLVEAKLLINKARTYKGNHHIN